MLRYRPTEIILTLADVDAACRRIVEREESMALRNGLQPVPRIRRGARRECNDAIRCQPTSTELARNGIVPQLCQFQWSTQDLCPESDAAFLPEENVQEAELSPPRYRKDLTRLGVPPSNLDPMSTLAYQFTTSLALDGANDASRYHRSTRVTFETSGFGQSEHATLPGSPLQQNQAQSKSLDETHVPGEDAPRLSEEDQRLDSHRTSSLQDAETWTRTRQVSHAHCSFDVGSNAATHESCAPAQGHDNPDDARYVSNGPSRIRSLYNPNPPGRGQPDPKLRPAVVRLSSISTPNLTSRTVSSDIIHLHRVPSSVGTSRQPSGNHSPLLEVMTPRAISEPSEHPWLEIMKGYVSPLENLRHKFEALSGRSSSSSSSSFHTAATQARHGGQSTSDLDSPRMPHLSVSKHGTKATSRCLTSSVDWVEAEQAEKYPETPMRIRPVSLPAPDQPSTVAATNDLMSPSKDPVKTDLEAYSYKGEGRNDSGIDITASQTQGLLDQQSQDQVTFPDMPNLPTSRAVPPQSNPNNHGGFTIFSPGIDGLDDYSRYPNPNIVMARRSVPNHSSAGLDIQAGLAPLSRSPERPYSQNTRSRSHRQPRQRQLGAAALVRTGVPRHTFSDRLPPRPHTAHVHELPAMPAARHRNQENDGSAEDEMMREELQHMRLRGGGEVRHSNENAPAPIAQLGVVDDTPPREGRFERLLRD